MRDRFRRCQWTLSALGAGALFWLVSSVFDLDLFEKALALLASAERLELDELVFLAILVSLGGTADALLHRQRQADLLELQIQRLQVMKTTMRTVLDVHGNFLNQVNYFVFTAENAGLTEESLREMKAAIRGTSERLQKLANLKDLPEWTLSTGEAMIHFEGDGKKPTG